MADKKKGKGKGKGKGGKPKRGLAIPDPTGHEFTPSERIGEVWLCIDSEPTGEVDSQFSEDGKTTATDVGIMVVWEDGEVKELLRNVRVFGAALQHHVIPSAGNFVAGKVAQGKKGKFNPPTILEPLGEDDYSMVLDWVYDNCKVDEDAGEIAVKKSALEEPF